MTLRNWCINTPTPSPPERDHFKACVSYLCRKDLALQARDCSLQKGLLARLALSWHLGTWIPGGLTPSPALIRMARGT